MTLKDANRIAKEHSRDMVIKIAAVTKDKCVVTTLACVRYQEEQNNLKTVYECGRKVKTFK